jgi:N-acetyltransferase
MIVDQELGFIPRSDDHKTWNNNHKNEPTTYLCVVEKRVVGMVLVEEITTAYRIFDITPTPPPLTSSVPATSETKQLNFGLTRSNQPSKAVLGIYQIWVHDKHRCRGIASALVDVARKHMYFGYSAIPVDQIAFSSPTESGLAFAKLYNHRHQNSNAVLVYDCC